MKYVKSFLQAWSEEPIAFAESSTILRVGIDPNKESSYRAAYLAFVIQEPVRQMQQVKPSGAMQAHLKRRLREVSKNGKVKSTHFARPGYCRWVQVSAECGDCNH